MFRVYKKTGQAWDEKVSIKRSSSSKEFKRRTLELDSAFERQGWRGWSGSLIIEVERRVQELNFWEIITLQICVQATPLEVDSRRMHCLIEAKFFLTSPGKETKCKAYKLRQV